MHIDTNGVLRDPAGRSPAWYDALTLRSGGSRIYGQIYVPDGEFSGPRPCVCLFHGFPGTMNNDDLAFALLRMGCAVVRIHHRGAWGSEGYYTVTNCIGDALTAARWAISPEAAAQYRIDTDRVFLVGHSMGGHTALNAARQLPGIRGTAAIAPYNVAADFKSGRPARFQALIADCGGVLRQETPTAIFDDAAAHWPETDLENAAAELAARPLCLIGADGDTLAPADEMLLPLWRRLPPCPAGVARQLKLLDADHGFCSRRIALARCLGAWLAAACGD